jgi:hypothetical protein
MLDNTPRLNFLQEESGAYYPGLHLTYVDRSTSPEDFSVIWFEEMIHRSCFDWTWLKYRFSFSMFRMILAFVSMLERAKKEGIKLKLPIKQTSTSCPDWVAMYLDEMSNSERIDVFYLATLDTIFHALFLCVFEDIKYDMFSSKEIVLAKENYKSIPNDFRSLASSMSPEKLAVIRSQFNIYKQKAFKDHPELEQAYRDLKSIETAFPDSKDYHRIILFIINPEPILPPIASEPLFEKIKDNPRYNIQTRFNAVVDIVKNNVGNDIESIFKEIETRCKDKFIDSLYRPLAIEKKLKAYSGGNTMNWKNESRFYTEHDFGLLLFYPQYQHSLQIEGDDIVFNITRSVLTIIKESEEKCTYIQSDFVEEPLVRRLLQIIIFNEWMNSVVIGQTSVCLPKIEPKIFSCEKKCDGCFLSRYNDVLESNGMEQ